MNIVYNSSHYHVVEYPTLNSYELIDKQLGMAAYLEGRVADSFRKSLTQLIQNDPTIDSVDEFLDGFDAVMLQPLRFH